MKQAFKKTTRFRSRASDNRSVCDRTAPSTQQIEINGAATRAIKETNDPDTITYMIVRRGVKTLFDGVKMTFD
jgi:hypothetical protein